MVILHLDLDCFYAQVEAVRLKIPLEAQPLAVQQWNGLIAINYKARAVGVERHDRIQEARQKAPNLKAVHVALYKKGETTFRYYDNQTGLSPMDHKVSLDPYRIESKKIMAICKEVFGAVEKASVDEVYIDGSNSSFESSMFSLDKVKLLSDQEIPSQYQKAAARAVHLSQRIRQELGYTVSIGISSNKLLAKLCSSHNKPDCVSMLVPGDDVESFIDGISIRKVRGLGGKIGQACEQRQLTKMHQLRDAPLSEFLDGSQVAYVQKCLKGICNEPINPRIVSKSFLSAKSLQMNGFRSKKITNDVTQLFQWLTVLNADVINRCVDEYECNSRWPNQFHLQISYTEGNLDSFDVTEELDDKNDDEDEEKPQAVGSSQTYSQLVKAPHPSVVKAKLYHMLKSLLSRDFPQEVTSQNGINFVWIGLKAQSFEPLQKKNNITSFFQNVGSSFQYQDSMGTSISTAYSFPKRSRSPEPTIVRTKDILPDEAQKSDDFDEFVDLTFEGDGIENVDSNKDSSNSDDGDFRLIVCDICGESVLQMVLQEHIDHHVAQSLMDNEASNRREHLQHIHQQKLNKKRKFI